MVDLPGHFVFNATARKTFLPVCPIALNLP